MTKFKQGADYWDRKTANYLHDPPDKALRIQGHEERTLGLLEELGLDGVLDKSTYQRADIIAAGMDRNTMPGYSSDVNKNGAINFCQSPQLTHPTGREKSLTLDIDLPQDQTAIRKLVQEIHTRMKEIIQNDLDPAGGGGLSDLYKNDPDSYSAARFHYLHHVYRRRLVDKNVAGFGAAWHRMPADTRIPDHSIWQHAGLVSALASCFELSDESRASLMVFSITPVQDFIGKARKLRDFWSGSVILSWLAFEGIKAIIHNLGSDHVLYPSLLGQPLVESHLGADTVCGLERFFKSSSNPEAASFPNKFVCLVPKGKEKELAGEIEKAITDAWLELGEKTLEMVENTIGQKDDYLRQQFDRQLGSYWEFQWAASPVVRGVDLPLASKMLHEDVLARPVDIFDRSKQFFSNQSGEGPLYAVSHALAQGMLAAGKGCRTNKRSDEPGIKCSQFGEFQALCFGKDKETNPAPKDDPFWSLFKEKWQTKTDFKSSERLCAIALVKRIAYRVCQQMKAHPLKKMFQKADIFPSTTEIALHQWVSKVSRDPDPSVQDMLVNLDKKNKGAWKKKLAQYVHARDETDVSPEIVDISQADEGKICGKIFKKAPLRNHDRYYAILMMDGDRMGKLVNGETLASRWQTVLHPELVERLEKENFDAAHKDIWQPLLHDKKLGIRLLSPAVHAAISEALGDFSLYAVPQIIKKYHGKLIYAGGDDVAALLPAATALQAAKEIEQSYRAGFVIYDENGFHPLHTNWKPQKGKLAVHLGTGQDLTISAGLLVAHHKKPLSAAIRRAHELLALAKDKAGRNALALELDKRSGGGRIFMTGWQESVHESFMEGESTVLDHFNRITNVFAGSKRQLSSSLIYRLDYFQHGLCALLKECPEKLPAFIGKQIDRSSLGSKEDKESLQLSIAALLAGKKQAEADRLPTEILPIARFMGECRIGMTEEEENV